MSRGVIAHPARGGGECFFNSLAQILQSEHDRLPDNLRKYTDTKTLRRIVATTVCKLDNEVVDRCVYSWWQLVNDAKRENNLELLKEYAHARCLIGVSESDINNQNVREALSRAMMQPPLYWGDEYALRIIQQVFGMRIHVYDAQLGQWRHPVCDVESRTPTYVCGLLLKGCHYEPLSFDGDFLFQYKD